MLWLKCNHFQKCGYFLLSLAIFWSEFRYSFFYLATLVSVVLQEWLLPQQDLQTLLFSWPLVQVTCIGYLFLVRLEAVWLTKHRGVWKKEPPNLFQYRGQSLLWWWHKVKKGFRLKFQKYSKEANRSNKNFATKPLQKTAKLSQFGRKKGQVLTFSQVVFFSPFHK